jgi:tetratricopeptide (TPR) repeat protein
MLEVSDNPIQPVLSHQRVAFVGKLGGVTKREAQQLVRQHGGVPVDQHHADVTLIVIGADAFPLAEEKLLDHATRRAAAEGALEIISETQLWQRLGLMETERHVRRLYTPAMLADLLGVPVSIIRRWHRRGLIVPTREVNRLPYFEFQEVATARRLAELLAAGASPRAIERKLEELARYVPDVERPLAQLSVIVEGQQLLLRQGEGLIELGGQLRFDFDRMGLSAAADSGADEPTEIARAQATVPISPPSDPSCLATPEEILAAAAEFEDRGDLDAALEMYRTALVAGGPRAEVCFQLAELLYRLGDVGSARERYYMAIELDEDFVEARANLGCVLAETGQLELAVAAFRGALEHHTDYPDVHYHLARTLDELGREQQAAHHWKCFLALAPDSPWAEEGRQRLGLSMPP